MDDFERKFNLNIEGDESDDSQGSKRKKYHRHSAWQIQELESAFKENPHPDEKTRLNLGVKLTLEPKQIKFWFQNRRTQMKAYTERNENSIMKYENDKLRKENTAMKEAMKKPLCIGCRGQGEISNEEKYLKDENAQLKEEFDRMCVMTSKCLGIPVSSLISVVSQGLGELDYGVGRTGFSGLSALGGGSVDLGSGFTGALTLGGGSVDLGSGFTGALTLGGGSVDLGSGFTGALTPLTPTGIDATIEESMFVQLAMNAMNELVKLAQISNPLWVNSSDRSGETLNVDEYVRAFTPCIGRNPNNYSRQATKASGNVMINSLALIGILMDSNRFAEMFTSIIGSASTLDLVLRGTNGTTNGRLQLMQAQFLVLAPLIPVHQAKFLRFCEQLGEGVWAVVDVSVDGGAGGCRRLPSGCIVQDMSNGESKVIWVEHMEYDESKVHPYYHSLLKSSLGFGAQRWIANLKRQCESLAFLNSSTSPGIILGGKISVANLAKRMTHTFCTGVAGILHKWEIVQAGSSAAPEVMIRVSNGNPGEPSGVILSASYTVWMPVSHHCLFEFFKREETRPQWDVLSQNGDVQQMVQIAKGQDLGNCISLLRTNVVNGKCIGNDNGMLVLQETSTDASGSMVVHAAVDITGMNLVMNGGDSSSVVLLPSGFAIFPYIGRESNSTRPGSSNGEERGGGGVGRGRGARGAKGCLLTLGFQILVGNLPSPSMTTESVETVNALISRTIQAIRSDLPSVN